MKVSYEYYVDTFKGKICQPEFEDLVEPVIDLVKGYAEQFIAPWALEKNIDYYCLELKRAVCYQIDYLQANGGLNALKMVSITLMVIVAINSMVFLSHPFQLI